MNGHSPDQPCDNVPPTRITVDPDGVGAAAPSPVSGASRGSMIGRYRLLDLLGVGGFGEVWLAEQTEPVRRRVALKAIKPGMDSRAVIARFEAERQVLALMNHPGVARVLDAGTTERGMPYFVMEHVAGLPITAHCDKHKLSIEARLELFALVCDAVQHAHQKGVIHRDLKPSNVLVEYVGETATPKVIDFGVAKALHVRLTERTVFTELGQFIGTPEYMSPEQAEMTAQDIDTRSDIYSLGVLLYELLTGVLPFDGRSLRAAGYAAIQKIIREVEPPRPSTRLLSLGAKPAEHGGDTTIDQVAQRHSTDARTLVRRLRGDLDWVVMKCLEKDRARRYDSASALARELERYLRHEPVSAGPPSASYKLSKFVRRNRAGVAAAAAIAALVLAGSAVSVWQAVRATRAEHLAEQRRETAEAAQQQEATLRQLASDRLADTVAAKAAMEEEAAVTRAVNRFLNEDLFGVVDPDVAQGRQITVKEVLDTAAARLDALADQPRVESELRQTLGTIYRKLSDTAAAKAHLQRAIDLRERLYGADSLPYADSLEEMAWTLGYGTTPGGARDAAALMQRALAIREAALGPADPLVLRSRGDVALFQARGRGETSAGIDPLTLGMIARVRGMGESPEQIRETIERETATIERLWAQGHKEAAVQRGLKLNEPVLNNKLLGDRACLANTGYGSVLVSQNRLHAAEAVATIALRIGEQRLGRKHPDVFAAMSLLAYVRFRLGDQLAGEAMFRETIATATEVLGPEHETTLLAQQNLATELSRTGRQAAAVEIYEAVIPAATRRLGEAHITSAYSVANLADTLASLERFDEAETTFRRACRIVNEHFYGTELHAVVLGNYSDMLLRLNRLDEAADQLATFAVIHEEAPVRRPLERERLALLTGRCAFKRGQIEQAASNLEVAYSGYLASQGPKSRNVRIAAAHLAHIARTRGDSATAEDYREKSGMTWAEVEKAAE